MANAQDIDLAVRGCREALQKNDLPGAQAALKELGDLIATFEDVKQRARDDEQRDAAQQLLDQATGERDELRGRVRELELDMLDPGFEQRSKRRAEEKAARDSAEKAKASQFLQGLGGPFAALAGLANLATGAAGAAAGAASEVARSAAASVAAGDEVACPACQTTNPKRAKFCMECGKPMVRRCAACQAELGKAKFCPECGAKA